MLMTTGLTGESLFLLYMTCSTRRRHRCILFPSVNGMFGASSPATGIDDDGTVAETLDSEHKHAKVIDAGCSGLRYMAARPWCFCCCVSVKNRSMIHIAAPPYDM